MRQALAVGTLARRASEGEAPTHPRLRVGLAHGAYWFRYPVSSNQTLPEAA
jgi:hypothetical protein